LPKPSTVFAWATDSAYSGGDEDGEANKIAPTSGKRAEGWEPGEEPAPEVLNDVLNHIGQWIEYLDSGFFEGDVQVDGDLYVLEGLNVSEASSLADVIVDGDVVLTGGDVYHESPQSIDLNLNNPIITNGSMPAGVPSSIPTWELSTNGVVWIHVPLRRGHHRPLSYEIVYEDNSPPNLELHIYDTDGTNAVATFGTSGGASFTTTDVDGTWTKRKATITSPIVIPADGRAWLKIEDSGTAALVIISAAITYDAPAL
jgi:hypothetical protein